MHAMPLSNKEISLVLQAMAGVLLPMQHSTAEPPTAVELLVLSDAAMARLNHEAMGLPGPTNVLSFPAGTPHSLPPQSTAATPLLGSLALGVHTLRREAFLYGQPLAEHCLHLLAHGMAHLAGFDHGPEMDECAAALEQAGAFALTPELA
ncbi:rRNA maturation RNase YbeY [Desulfovibrio cuneatus]|uniref:rRNA maturation RNase YbeY n=1 Tax=Desulfovibrio cuneatus TaxID=159728 RepID=UPI0009FDCA02